MYQRIDCANCGKVIMEMIGGSWVEDGWISCDCLFETQVAGAKVTKTCRPISRPLQPLPNYTRSIEEASVYRLLDHAKRE